MDESTHLRLDYYYTFIKKHYYPNSLHRLKHKFDGLIVDSKSEEAKYYDFDHFDGYLSGNIYFMHSTYVCEECGKTYRISELID